MAVSDSVSPRKGVVVVVEDDYFVMDFLRFSLEHQGYEVYVSMDGKEGLDLIQKRRPALVVLDLMLPTMDGFSVLKKLGEDPETAHIPVVVASAYTVSESTRRMVESQKNVRGIFSKPIRAQEFADKVKAICEAG